MGTKLVRFQGPMSGVPKGPPGPVRGLILDACNVLYDDTTWRRWLVRLLGRLGLQTHCGCFFRVLEQDCLRDVHTGKRPMDEALESFLRSAGLSRGQAEEVKTAFHSYCRSTEASLRLLTGVRQTLQQLHACGVALGIVCNSEHPAAVLRERFDRLVGNPVLAAVVSSRDVGRVMPDPACFGAALEALHLPPEHVPFVGHAAADLAGAAALGLFTIAFNPDADAQADLYLQRFEGLLDLAGRARTLAAAG